MRILEPDHALEQMGETDWRFVLSAGMQSATDRFDRLLDSGASGSRLTARLRAFLNECPNHIDALYHYAMCKLQEGKPLDSFAYAHAAVAIGHAAFPRGFELKADCLPGGWIENRPFLRALWGLMTAQGSMQLTEDAITTARELILCDSQDRMGARLVLPLYLLELNRDREALELFERPDFEGTFGPTSYLHALALIRLGREGDLPAVWQPCLRYYPKVAEYLVNRDLPRPEDESPFGMVMGSDFEAWDAAVQQRWVWERTPGAIDFLRTARKAYLPLGSPPTT